MKNILILSSSARMGGNSEALARQFEAGAKAVGHHVDFVRLADKDIRFCRGCLACQKTMRCAIDDGVKDILPLMKAADVVVFATPIYYYGMSGLMKTMLDRSNPLFSQEYQFRDIYLLTAAADTDPRAADRAVTALSGWIDCYPKCALKGVVFANGVTNIGDIKSHKALEEAYAAGKNA